MDLVQVPRVGSVVGGSEETGNEIVNGKSKSQYSEEGGRREACVGEDGLLQRVPDLQSHGGWRGRRVKESEREREREREIEEEGKELLVTNLKRYFNQRPSFLGNNN